MSDLPLTGTPAPAGAPGAGPVAGPAELAAAVNLPFPGPRASLARRVLTGAVLPLLAAVTALAGLRLGAGVGPLQAVTAGLIVAWAAAAVAARTSDGAAVDAVVVGSDGWATISITAIAVGTISEQLTSSRLVRSSGSTTVLVTGAG